MRWVRGRAYGPLGLWVTLALVAGVVAAFTDGGSEARAAPDRRSSVGAPVPPTSTELASHAAEPTQAHSRGVALGAARVGRAGSPRSAPSSAEGRAGARVASPLVEPPPSGGRGHAYGSPPYRVQDIGYTAEEFLISGTAKTYTSPSKTAPYKTRVLVVRPSSATRFNGTVIAEWENVTGQLPGAVDFAWLHPYVFASGYAYAMVYAQQGGPFCDQPVGTCASALRAWDPVRYGSLEYPGDDYALDIYSQAMKAIREPKGLAPLGPLRAKHAIAIGQSQSARFIYRYTVQAQNDARVFDGIISDADIYSVQGDHPWKYPDLHTPFIQFNSEDSFQATSPVVSDAKWYRLYDVVGASHVDADATESPSARATAQPTATPPQPYPYAEEEAWYRSSHYGEEGPSGAPKCTTSNRFPRRYALDAAVDAMNIWLTSGIPAPPSVRSRSDAAGRPALDEQGNRTGGWRLPPIDVPVATYVGVADDCGPNRLNGSTIPLPADSLVKLYPTHGDYVAKLQAATDAAVAKRWLLRTDAAELMAKAKASKVPLWK